PVDAPEPVTNNATHPCNSRASQGGNTTCWPPSGASCAPLWRPGESANRPTTPERPRGARSAIPLERRLQRVVDGAQHLHPGEALVVGFHQGPGGDAGTGAIHHVFHRVHVLVPLLAVAPVLVGDLEALV